MVVISSNFRILFTPDTDQIVTACRFFSYSLDGRIDPRYKVMVENRVNFKLRYMLASTDEEFNQRVEDAVERRRRFESGVTKEAPSDSDTTDVISESEIVVSNS